MGAGKSLKEDFFQSKVSSFNKRQPVSLEIIFYYYFHTELRRKQENPPPHTHTVNRQCDTQPLIKGFSRMLMTSE